MIINRENVSYLLFIATIIFPFLTLGDTVYTNIYYYIVIIYFLFERNLLIKFLKNFFENNILKILFFFLIFFLLYNIYISENITLTLSRIINIFKYSFVCICLIYLLKKYKKLNFYISISAFGLIIFICLDLLYELYFGSDIFSNNSAYKNMTRLAGPFGGELIPGTILKMFVFISLFTLMEFIDVKYKNVIIVSCLIIIGFFIFLTGERTSFIMFCFGSFIYFILLIYYKSKSKIYFYSIIISLILILIIFLSILYLNYKAIKENETNIFTRQLSSIETIQNFKTSRYFAHFYTSYSLWEKRPLLGYGFKSYRIVCDQINLDDLKKYNKQDHCSTHPHNYYLEVLVEGGIILLLLILLLEYLFYKKIYKIVMLYRNSEINYLFIGSLITCIILFWPFATTSSLFSTQIGNSFFFILAICYSNFSNILNKETEK